MPPLPPTYSPVGCEAEGADVGIYCEGPEETACRQPQPAQAVRTKDNPLALLRRGKSPPLTQEAPARDPRREADESAEELNVVFMNFGAIRGAGAHWGRRGGGGRTHSELSPQRSPELGRAAERRREEERGERGATRRKRARGSGKEGRACPLFPLLIALWAAKLRGRTWGFTAPTTPRSPRST